MPSVDLVDETFVVASRERVAALLRDPATWRAWWPDLTLTVFEDRKDDGIRWSCTGALVGSCEVWLEPWCDGVLVHYYLRADPTVPGSSTEPRSGGGLARQSVAVRERWARHTKAKLFALKDQLEAGREVGAGTVVAGPVGSRPLGSGTVGSGTGTSGTGTTSDAGMADRSATMPDAVTASPEAAAL